MEFSNPPGAGRECEPALRRFFPAFCAALKARV